MIHRLAKYFLLGAALCSSAAMAGNHDASNYPERPIRIIVGSAAGGYLDIISRAVADELSKKWGQTFIVENRPGASGAIAAMSVKEAAPDGYTWLASTEAHHVVNPFLQKNIAYDFDRDFTGLSALTRADQMVIVRESVPVDSLQELIELAKNQRGSLFYGSWGIGSHPHLFYSQLGALTDTEFRMIPYKGVAPTMQALRSGEVQYSMISAGTAKPLLDDGVVKVLASASSERSSLFPEVPTTEELGFKDLRSNIYMLLMVPKATPTPIVEKASAAIQEVITQPAFAEHWITSRGFEVVASDSAGMAEILADLRPIVERAVKAGQIEPQ